MDNIALGVGRVENVFEHMQCGFLSSLKNYIKAIHNKY